MVGTPRACPELAEWAGVLGVPLQKEGGPATAGPPYRAPRIFQQPDSPYFVGETG